MERLSESIPRRHSRWPKSWSRRLLFVGIYIAFCWSLVWFGWHFYWNWQASVPFFSTVKVWDHFFPELNRSGLTSAQMSPNDDTLDVVLLGASTIEKGWSDIEQRLQAGLQRELQRPVRIFNLAVIAHTSRDSALKYSRVADKPIDVVIIYDGFNDCRMNNVHDADFKPDYTHCSRYHAFEQRLKAGELIIPIDVARDFGQQIGLGSPEPNLVQYGRTIKSRNSFRDNLLTIMKCARQQKTLVVLQTFAFYIPKDYSDSRLERGELGYGMRNGTKRCPLHMWGETEAVRSCVMAHNEVIQELARTSVKDTVLIDQSHLLGGRGENFVDACHLTDLGSQRYVENLLPPLVKALQNRTH